MNIYLEIVPRGHFFNDDFTLETFFIMLGVLVFVLAISKILNKGNLCFPLVKDKQLVNYTLSFNSSDLCSEDLSIVKENKVSFLSKIVLFLISFILVITPFSELIEVMKIGYNSIWGSFIY